MVRSHWRQIKYLLYWKGVRVLQRGGEKERQRNVQECGENSSQENVKAGSLLKAENTVRE